jgi:hypothetical protein
MQSWSVMEEVSGQASWGLSSHQSGTKHPLGGCFRKKSAAHSTLHLQVLKENRREISKQSWLMWEKSWWKNKEHIQFSKGTIGRIKSRKINDIIM